MIVHERLLQCIKLQNGFDEKGHVFEMERLTEEGTIKLINIKDNTLYVQLEHLRYLLLMRVVMKWNRIYFDSKGMLLPHV